MTECVKRVMVATRSFDSFKNGVWIPKMWVLEGAIDGTHTSSDVLLKNDHNNKHDYHFGKDHFKFIFIDFKHHRNRDLRIKTVTVNDIGHRLKSR